VTNTVPEDPEQARPLVAHTLVQYVKTLSHDHAPVAMALVVPTLLTRAASEGGDDLDFADVYRETSARLLELASINQDAFRGVVTAMSEGQKAFMEEVIKSGRQPDKGSRMANEGSGQPSIELKMDFGG
jgi:hypothetical protein